MFRRFSVNFAIFSMAFDATFVMCMLVVATYVRPFLSSLPFAAEFPQFLRLPIILYPVFAFAWVFILLLLNVYDGRKNVYITDEISSLTLGSILAGVALAGTLYLTYRDVSRLLFLFFVLICYLSMLSWRLIFRWVFRKLNGKAIQYRQVLIIGAGPVGRELQEKLTQHQYLGLHLVGFLDDDTAKRATQADILGSIRDTRKVISEKKIDDVVIALPRRAYERVNNLVTELHDLPVKVWVIPDYFHLALHRAVFDDFAGIPMLDLRAPALNDYQRMTKRAFDLLITFFCLLPALLLMGVIAILIKIEDHGPVLFKQKRVGENGRIFEMIKFRSMVIGADRMHQLVEQFDSTGKLIHKMPDDPRITRIGKFLRRTSLDEIPQIFNIIRGEMSLVGPRPELPYLVQMYEPWQHKRFAVPQGVTGWWQVNGRSDKPMHLNTEDDLFYVQNYSILLDIQILLKTVLVVLRGKGAF
jgi:exopolysaccharide biosynthesis polyprenyl glycosylphosphotransferase